MGDFESKKSEENKRSAVAIEYDRSWARDAAPRITAKGEGYVADEILKRAQDIGLPVERNQDLLNLLYAVDLGDEIPVDAFVVVAEILRYIYEKNGEL